eukprot:CAMPEP_0178953920 /NCGR_PEP_ID=MMETSP0789-20121207/8693_1 /TAXON_ID=3005 /ORGANISM="Rhizosolenia setigera, Strain CCMP 1694" /LENGTH=368 /DNA_ID=CAMNT_0020635245 /DNA_START=117 /DNA_END=1223 /DNA_ORIENTATION=+
MISFPSKFIPLLLMVLQTPDSTLSFSTHSPQLAFVPNTIGSSSVTNRIPSCLFMSDEAEEAVAEAEPVVEASTEPEPASDEFKIFIGNISYETTEENIRELFEEFGEIDSLNVPLDRESGLARGFAFVQMSSKEDGLKAIEALDKIQNNGRTIRVSEQRSKEELAELKKNRAPVSDPQGSKIYVGNIPFDAGSEDLISMFEEFGEVSDCYIPTDRVTGNPRGFAFIAMASDEAGEAAIENLNGRDFGGRILTVNKSLPKGQAAEPRKSLTKIYVGNLSFQTSQEEVYDLFSEYGEVTDCYLPISQDDFGRPRGFGFVTMDDDDAAAAIEELDGIELDGRFLRVNEAQPKYGNRPVNKWGEDDEDEVEE